jgi:hypothetical protein
MKALVPLLLFLALAPSASASNVVTPYGRVGDVYVGNATMDDVRTAEGRPDRVGRWAGDPIAPAHTRWTYVCGGGRFSTFYFTKQGVLANFFTTCRSWRTKKGTRVGMDEFEAVDREGKEPQGRCGSGTSITYRGRSTLEVIIDNGSVWALTVDGPNDVLGC